MTKEDIQRAIESENLCDSEFRGEAGKKALEEMGRDLCKWFDDDEESRRGWYQRSEQWLKLATQLVEKKSHPWPGAANVKYPLLTTAAMQFGARAYPALVPGPNLVSGLVVGRDESGEKAASAARVGRHMSYQLLFKMHGWEEDMDRLCITLPIVGCMFKKTYYDELNKTNCSELIFPQDLVIDYYAKSIDSATRKAHVIHRTANEIKERVRQGLWREIYLGEPEELATDNKTKDAIQGTTEPDRYEDTPHKFIEYHCLWDMDDDGYKEPYIITVHYKTKQVVRIVVRYEMDGVQLNDKNEIVKITPIEYFTKFGFIPSPDGSIYDLGFGILLGGINESINTLTNQLLDAGTLSILQAGFLGKGIRIRGGNTRFSPGEWKPVDFTGDDIKKHIYPIPAKEPSDVLLKLLELLVGSGKELGSIADIMVGKMPGQNTPATTTMATLEQSQKIMTAIYKRIYRALGKEYEKLFRLNALYSNEEEYFTINQPEGPEGQVIYKKDYDLTNIGIKPNADPTFTSQSQKLMRMQSIGPLLQIRTVNPTIYTKRYLEAIDEPNIAELMGDGKGGPYTPPPPPEVQMKQAEGMQKAQEAQDKMKIAQMQAALDAQAQKMDMMVEMMKAQLEERKAMGQLAMEQQSHQMSMQQQQEQHQMDMMHSEDQHQEGMRQTREQGSAKAEAIKTQAAAKPKPKPKGD